MQSRIYTLSSIIIARDLNFSMGREEILQKSRIDSMAAHFRGLMEEFSLLDVTSDPIGPTWRYCRTIEQGVSNKMDRFMVNKTMDNHPTYIRSYIIPTFIYDHLLITMTWDEGEHKRS